MAISLADLVVAQSKAAIYTVALSVAETLGLPVTSWQPGDPTRSTYHVVAEVLGTLEQVVVSYIGAGFLDSSSGDWLTYLAKQVFDVDRIEATYAGTPLTLTNAGGGVYVLDPGDLTVKASGSGATYRNTAGGTLSGGGTLTLDVVADEAGSASSAGAGDIDTMVTGLLGVTCSNATAAVGTDAESDASLRQRCRDKLGALSPNGPRAAYAYVARTPALAGTSAVTRTRVFTDPATGVVTVYLAGPSGAVLEADRALVEEAILTNAAPLTVTPDVVSADDLTVPVTYTLWVYKRVNKTSGAIESAVEAALAAMFAARPIGGDIIPPATTGALYTSLIESTIRGVFPDDTFRVSVTTPATSSTAMGNADVAVLGTVTATVHLITDPE